MIVLFDSAHGQKNWGKTGFPPRGLETTFEGVAKQLRDRGFSCEERDERISSAALRKVNGLVIPPPTGHYESDLLHGGHWEPTESSLLTAQEIEAILTFVRQGGWLFAFSYRFGDSFTKSNLGQLFATLGIILNDDAVMDIEAIEKHHPFDGLLRVRYDMDGTFVSQPWRGDTIKKVALRPTSTFSVLQIANAVPVVMSPATSVRYQFHFEKTYYDPAPICVAGRHGEGRYVLFGGPQQFESTDFGLLAEANNSDLMSNLIDWLISSESSGLDGTQSSPDCGDDAVTPSENERTQAYWQYLSSAKNTREKETSFVAFVKHLLGDSGALKLFHTSAWSLERASEIDLVYECTKNAPLWTACRGIVPVECKNEKSGIDGEKVSWFSQKVNGTGSQLGFFAARSFTKPAWSVVKDIRNQCGTLIGLLHDEDFLPYVAGETTALKVIESSIVRTMLL